MKYQIENEKDLVCKPETMIDSFMLGIYSEQIGVYRTGISEGRLNSVTFFIHDILRALSPTVGQDEKNA